MKEISFIPYNQIDLSQWDNCVKNAGNGLLYAKSFYLSNMTDQWDGLVYGNYEAVMPLVWRKKWGIQYLYQPSFIQQLGIFYKEKLTDDVLESFMTEALERFSYADFTINFANTEIFLPAGATITSKENFVVSLDRSYQLLYENYDPGFTKSLRRIQKFGLTYHTSNNIEAVIDLYKELYAKRLESVTEKDIQGFISICKILQQQNDLVIREAKNENGELVACVLLLKDEKRLYNMISCITNAGKKLEANYFLYDRLINEFSETLLLLDLEGSDRKGIAAFYKKFNPVSQPYLHVKQNDLHPVLKLFKR